MQQIILASGNQGKLNEFNQMLSAYGISVIPQSQLDVKDVPETGTTFVENAIIKARHAAEVTGMPAIADDSGLEVDYLLGAPGIYSARYAGEHATMQQNIEKLLAALHNAPRPRLARFQCVLVYMRHAADPSPIISQASWEGHISLSEKGHNGHGYDPIFIPENHLCCAAELNSSVKNALSHRGKALVKLITEMEAQELLTAENSQ